VEGRDMPECRAAANMMSAAADLILAGVVRARQGPRTPPPDRMPLIRISLLTPAADYIVEGEEKDLCQRFPQVLAILNDGAKIITMILQRRQREDAATVH
jgi:hypothetical protein